MYITQLAALYQLLGRMSNPITQPLVRAFHHFMTNDGQQSARSLTYTTLLALVPFITIFILVLSTVDGLQAERNRALDALYSYLLPATELSLRGYLDNFSSASTGLTALGIVFLFVTSLFMLLRIEIAVNQMWGVSKQYHSWSAYKHYWMLITVGPIVFSLAVMAISAITSSYFIHHMHIHLFDWHLDLVWIIRLLVNILFGLGLSLFFWLTPDQKYPYRFALIAAIVTLLLLGILRHGFVQFVTSFTNYTLIYGVFAAFPLLLIWINLIWIIILFGVSLSFVLYQYHHNRDMANAFKPSDTETPAIIRLLHLLYCFDQHHQTGRVVSVNTLGAHQAALSSIAVLKADLSRLETSGFIARINHQEYVLCQALSSLPFISCCQRLQYNIPHPDILEHELAKHPILLAWIEALFESLSNYQTHYQAINCPLQSS